MVKRKSAPSARSQGQAGAPADPAQQFSAPALVRAEGLAAEAAARDPDRFDVYIYNDYHAYGCAEVLENALNLVHAKVMDKEYRNAFTVLEGLTRWCARDTTFTTMDDGDRCNSLVKLLLSAWVHVAQAGNAEVKDIVNYRFVLGETAKLGKALQDCGIVSQGHTALQDLLDGKEIKASSKKQDPDFYDFDALYKDYVNNYGKDGKIGGDAFDLSKQDTAKLQAEHGLQSNGDEDSEGEAGSLPQMMLTTMNETLAAQGRPLMSMEDIHGILMRSFMGGGDEDDEEDEDEEDDEGEGEEEEEEEEEEEQQGEAKKGSTNQQAPTTGGTSKKARK